MAVDLAKRGFTDGQILDSFVKFEEETKDERKKYETNAEFNDAIVKTKGKVGLGKICKGLFVGNLFLKQAIKRNPTYPIAYTDDFIILIPFGPIQSVIHLLAVPNVPIYNTVSMDESHVLLCQSMQAALVQVVCDIMTPGSKPQDSYLRTLGKAVVLKESEIANIRITQKETELDTLNMDGGKALTVLRDMINGCHAQAVKAGTPLNEMVCTDMHIHDTNTVGQLHLHGWVAAGLITDNGRKLLYKNTPMDRIVPLIYKHLGSALPAARKIRVEVEK